LPLTLKGHVPEWNKIAEVFNLRDVGEQSIWKAGNAKKTRNGEWLKVSRHDWKTKYYFLLKIGRFYFFVMIILQIIRIPVILK